MSLSLLMDDDGDGGYEDDPHVPVPAAAPKKRALPFDDDDDYEDIKAVVVAPPAKKRPKHVVIPAPTPTVVAPPVTTAAKASAVPVVTEVSSERFLREMSHGMPSFFNSSVLSPPASRALPPHTVMPASRPIAPTPLLSPAPNLATELDSIRKELSDTARSYLKFMLSFNPQIKERRRDKRTGHTIPRVKEDEIKGPARPVMTVNTFQHDQQLLFYPVERMSPLVPNLKIKARPCANGVQCIGAASPHLPCREFPPNAPRFEHGPLMEYHTAHELQVHYLTGANPVTHRECLRCSRYVWCDLALFTAGSGNAWGPSSILQSFANTVGGETGYAPEVCVMPSTTGGNFNGLIQPLAHERDDRLFINWDPVTKAPFVDQRGLASAQQTFAEDYPRGLWRQVISDYRAHPFPQGATAVATATRPHPSMPPKQSLL